jgi:hypothetical protein
MIENIQLLAVDQVTVVGSIDIDITYHDVPQAILWAGRVFLPKPVSGSGPLFYLEAITLTLT